MATQNVPGMYSPFSAVVNTSPSVNFYANLLARRQAKEDALDEYYRRLPSTINEQGVRDQDRPTITGQMNDAMKYWMENRDKIRNPNSDKGASQVEYENRLRQVRQIVDESKQRGKTGLELGKMRIEGKVPHVFESPEIVDAIAAHDLPIGVNGSNGIDLSTLTVPPPPFGAKEQEELSKTSVGGLKPSKVFNEQGVRRDTKSGQVFVPYEEVYSPDAIKTISSNYGNLADQSRSAQSYYTKLMHDPDEYEIATKAYQSMYGKDAIVDTPKKMAEAESILKLKTNVGKGEEMRADTDLAFKRQKIMEGIRQANRKEMVDYREDAKSLGEKTNEVWIDNYIDKLTEEANAPGKYMIYTHKGGGTTDERIVPMDAVLAKALTKGKAVPSDLTITKDGKYRPIYYKYDSKGERIPTDDGSYKVDEEISIPISREQLKLSLGAKTVSPTQRTKEMLNNAPETKPKTSKNKTRPPLDSFIKK